MHPCVHTEHANRMMGFTSYAEAYGALSGLWDIVQEDMDLLDKKQLDPEIVLASIRQAALSARQIKNQMKAQQ